MVTKRSAACSSSFIVFRCSPYFLPRKIQRRETVQVRVVINFVVLLSVNIHTFCNLIHRAMTLEEQTASTKVALKVKVLLLLLHLFLIPCNQLQQRVSASAASSKREGEGAAKRSRDN